MTSIGVLVVDDHNLVCAGLRLFLERFEGVRVVAEAHDGRDALVKEDLPLAFFLGPRRIASKRPRSASPLRMAGDEPLSSIGWKREGKLGSLSHLARHRDFSAVQMNEI